MSKAMENETPRRFRKPALALVVVLLVAVLAGALVMLLGTSPPSPETIADRETAIEVLANTDLSELPEAEKLRYADKMLELRPWEPKGEPKPGLSEEQQQQLDRNIKGVFAARKREDMNRYAAMPKAEQIAYLDQVINKLVAGKKAKGGGKLAAGKEKAVGKQPGKDEAAVKAWIDNWMQTTGAEERTRTLEYKRALVERMEQRGITWP
ncbi:MAG: hypothetical protein HN380_01900 [Victivallales bacterium]|nr:hypothetical protein [Victivallales bacterium]